MARSSTPMRCSTCHAFNLLPPS
ncbi:hypothetical protein AB4915_11305 [Bifidobacterium dentium]